MIRLLLAPANAMCDALHLTDEHERGMVRMLVNTMIWITIGATGWFLVWLAAVG